MHYNKMSNTKNPFQGDAKKVLCVCSAGLLRSPTMAKVLSEDYGYNTRAVGSVDEYALITITPTLIYWADEVVFAQEEHIYLTLRNPEVRANLDILGDTAVQVLNLPDIFETFDPKLVEYIRQQYNKFKVEKLKDYL